jgi:hypothetical protein
MTSKYPLESCGCPLPFWYRTLSQRSEGTAPYLNLLTVAHNQDRMDVVAGFSLFGGHAVGSSLATHYGAFKCYAPTRNLVMTIESPL